MAGPATRGDALVPWRRGVGRCGCDHDRRRRGCRGARVGWGVGLTLPGSIAGLTHAVVRSASGHRRAALFPVAGDAQRWTHEPGAVSDPQVCLLRQAARPENPRRRNPEVARSPYGESKAGGELGRWPEPPKPEHVLPRRQLCLARLRCLQQQVQSS
jgi:hypothetical protein